MDPYEKDGGRRSLLAEKGMNHSNQPAVQQKKGGQLGPDKQCLHGAFLDWDCMRKPHAPAWQDSCGVTKVQLTGKGFDGETIHPEFARFDLGPVHKGKDSAMRSWMMTAWRTKLLSHMSNCDINIAHKVQQYQRGGRSGCRGSLIMTYGTALFASGYTKGTHSCRLLWLSLSPSKSVQSRRKRRPPSAALPASTCDKGRTPSQHSVGTRSISGYSVSEATVKWVSAQSSRTRRLPPAALPTSTCDKEQKPKGIEGQPQVKPSTASLALFLGLSP
ncbi:MAG: hypothetical protein FRX49_05431 [Trebouxia sp. A1-2]|nr:MAG: hypothetical protein FRX49_05431 [Trebouxia sp. A1-2]